MMEDFMKQLEHRLSEIGTDILPYEVNEFSLYEKEYDFILKYSYEKRLINTAVALPVVRSLHDGMYRGKIVLPDGTKVARPYICHCLSVCRMLINLNLSLTPHEEDLALATALCHDVPAFLGLLRHNNNLTRIYKLDPEVTDLVDLIYTRDCKTDEDFDELFAKVTENKIAALVKLADRGNVIESLYNVSPWAANEYIHETRTYYLPMCIHLRENYPELDRVLGIVQGKLRDLTEASEIFSVRYMNMENEMTNRILQLTEENSRMRILIRNAGK